MRLAVFALLSLGFDDGRRPASQQTRELIIKKHSSDVQRSEITFTLALTLAHIMSTVNRSAKRNRSASTDGDLPVKNNEEEQKREEKADVEEEGPKEEGGDEQNRNGGEEVSVTGILEHITHPDFPLEILRKIIDFSLKPVRYCWEAPFTNHWDYRDSELPAEDLKTTSWSRQEGLTFPDNLSLRAQQAIRQAAIDTFSPSAIVGVPADFGDSTDCENGLRLVVPLALQGSEHRVRQLVMNVHKPLEREKGQGPYHHHLATATAGMKAIAQSFPRLETCVFVINLGPGPKRRHRGDMSQYQPPHLFRPRMLGAVGTGYLVGGGPSVAARKAAVADFIDAIARHGPGKRRFFRFDYHDRAYYCDGKYLDCEYYCAVGVGPLVQVKTASERIARVAAVDGDVGVVEHVATNAMQAQEPDVDSGGPLQSEAERLMYRAYRCSREVRCAMHAEENFEVQYPY
jgi:hypothetical protein